MYHLGQQPISVASTTPAATLPAFLHRTLSRSLHPRLRTELLLVLSPIADPAAASLSRSVGASSKKNVTGLTFDANLKSRLCSTLTRGFGGKEVLLLETTFASRWIRLQSAIAVVWVQEEWDVQALTFAARPQWSSSSSTASSSSSAATAAAPSAPPELLASRAHELLACSRDAVIVELLRPEWTTALKLRGYNTSYVGLVPPPAAAAGRPLTIVERLSRDAGMAYASIEIQPVEQGQVEYGISSKDVERAMRRLKRHFLARQDFNLRATFPLVLMPWREV
jgi:hypothetical protein